MSQFPANRDVMMGATASMETVSYTPFLLSYSLHWRRRPEIITAPVPPRLNSTALSGDRVTDETEEGDGSRLSEGRDGVNVKVKEEHRNAMKMDVQVALLISMPSPLRPRFYPSRASSSTSLMSAGQDHERTMSMDNVPLRKQAVKRNVVGGSLSNGENGVHDEEAIPAVEIGVIAVRVREQS